MENNRKLLKGIKIGKIPDEQFQEYRLQQIFDGYKWDYQSGSHQSTISDEVILLDEANRNFLMEATEALAKETVELELALREQPHLLRKLGLSERIIEVISTCTYDPKEHVRYMRFDFHPTTKGWRISEVNSDVPAGLQESSLHPAFAQKYFPDYKPMGNFANSLHEAVKEHLSVGDTIAYVYDSHTVEDMQLLRFLGDYFEEQGFPQFHGNPEQVEWLDNEAIGIKAIIRHYPAETLEYSAENILEKFFNTSAVGINHPIAVIAQSKRLPLVWDEVGVDVSTWKKMLPETLPLDVTSSPALGKWIFKPAFGRVGEGVGIPGSVSRHEIREIEKTAKANADQWIMQKMFKSYPIDGLHFSVGAFVVDGKFASCFSRASNFPLMNFTAKELPVLWK